MHSGHCTAGTPCDEGFAQETLDPDPRTDVFVSAEHQLVVLHETGFDPVCSLGIRGQEWARKWGRNSLMD